MFCCSSFVVVHRYFYCVLYNNIFLVIGRVVHGELTLYVLLFIKIGGACKYYITISIIKRLLIIRRGPEQLMLHYVRVYIQYHKITLNLLFYIFCNGIDGLGLVDCHISFNTKFACILSGTLDTTLNITYKIITRAIV